MSLLKRLIRRFSRKYIDLKIVKELNDKGIKVVF